MFKIKRTRIKKRDERMEEFGRLHTSARFGGRKVIISPKSKNKMSEVLGRFIEPYEHLATTRDELHKLISVASLAWNAALLPEDERRTFLNDACKAALPSGSANAIADFHSMMKLFIDRKERYFASDKRLVVDSELVETETGYHLSIASTPIAQTKNPRR